MTLSWLQIFRLGLVQMALGAIVVLTTSTLNRLMVMELGLPAIVPGLLVGFHYGIQLSRPKWGFTSDTGGNRTVWIIGGMVVLALGGIGAAVGVGIYEMAPWAGLVISVLAYGLIGIGVGASGTSLLALLATATAPDRRAAAATITWLTMIFGIAVTAITAGKFLDPYGPVRLIAVVSTVALLAVMMTTIAVWGIEKRVTAQREPDTMPFMEGLREIWAEREARNFTIFVFLSMNAYFMQELILEPFAGIVWGFSVGESTSLSGAQNGGTFMGMLSVGILATGLKIGSLRTWVISGCVGSAGVLAMIALAGLGVVAVQLTPLAMALGFFNGMFAVAAIGTMMALASKGRAGREGTRMGLWGAAQAIAAGFGGLCGAAFADVMRAFQPDATAFGSVFILEAILFLAAAVMAIRVMQNNSAPKGALIPGE